MLRLGTQPTEPYVIVSDQIKIYYFKYYVNYGLITEYYGSHYGVNYDSSYGRAKKP